MEKESRKKGMKILVLKSGVMRPQATQGWQPPEAEKQGTDSSLEPLRWSMILILDFQPPQL